MALVLVLVCCPPVWAGPTESLQEFFAAINKVLADPETEDQPLERVARIRPIVADMSDAGSPGSPMEEPCVKQHWGFVIDGELAVEMGPRREADVDLAGAAVRIGSVQARHHGVGPIQAFDVALEDRTRLVFALLMLLRQENLMPPRAQQPRKLPVERKLRGREQRTGHVDLHCCTFSVGASFLLPRPLRGRKGSIRTSKQKARDIVAGFWQAQASVAQRSEPTVSARARAPVAAVVLARGVRTLS